MTTPRLTTRSLHLWQAAQWLGLIVTIVLLVGMVVQPKLALAALWNVAIPLVPATLLLSPAIWRNVCPLATLNMLGNWGGGRRRLALAQLSWLWPVGMVLLFVLVPARRFLFNTNGPALAITVGLVAVGAVVLGMFFEMKAGFCNTLCPVLPVERLYGQSPLVTIGNPRCTPCSHCTQTACLDLRPAKSIGQVLGSARDSTRWMLTGFGGFAALFPGFVIGYNTIEDRAVGAAAAVYGWVLLWMVGSFLLVSAISLSLRLTAGRAMIGLAALAAGLYYWFGSRTIADTLQLGSAGVVILRVVFLSLVAIWLWRAGGTPARGATT